METIGERRDKARELRALETIAASLTLPQLKEALAEESAWVANLDQIAQEAKDARVAKIEEKIQRAENILGIPR